MRCRRNMYNQRIKDMRRVGQRILQTNYIRQASSAPSLHLFLMNNAPPSVEIVTGTHTHTDTYITFSPQVPTMSDPQPAADAPRISTTINPLGVPHPSWEQKFQQFRCSHLFARSNACPLHSLGPHIRMVKRSW